MAKDFDAMEDSNRSSNPDIHSVSGPARRTVLRLSLGAASAALFAPWLAGCATAAAARVRIKPGFKGVPVDSGDRLVVPDGYVAQAIAAWGEPVGIAGQMPAWKPDATHTAAEQALQMGMHHDGMHFYPLGTGNAGSPMVWPPGRPTRSARRRLPMAFR
jgi:secreted PhoX family phosphatase